MLGRRSPIRNRCHRGVGSRDINSGKPWSQADVDDLLAALGSDADLAEISEHLCWDWEEVAAKCGELKSSTFATNRARAPEKENARKKSREYWEQEHTPATLAALLARDDRSEKGISYVPRTFPQPQRRG